MPVVIASAWKVGVMAVDFAELRKTMVDNQIRTVDVTKLPVLSAFLTVPREQFVSQNIRNLAYLDTDVEVKPAKKNTPARYVMEPASLAKLLQAAGIRKSDVVLDIGAGTGYAAALLSQLAASVIALESDKGLADKASELLVANNCDNVVVVQGALNEGYAAEGPYDIILLEGAVDFIPDALFGQLRDGGRLLAVEGHGNAGVARLYVKEKDAISSRLAFNLAVKPLEGFLKKAEFVF